MAGRRPDRKVPLTPFQAEVLRLLAPNRSPESYVAGGIALNAAELVRWSTDVDVFHDAEEAVIRASEADSETLRHAGCAVRPEIWTPAFRRAWVERAEDGVKLEWCRDSAWRFFPIEPDALLGWRLHRFDAITNKALALGGRSETRDVVDLVANELQVSLHAAIWAACAKDPGFTPLLLLEQMRRNARIDPAELREMGSQFQPVELKKQWLRLAETAGQEIERAIAAGVELGLVFVEPDRRIAWFDSASSRPHRATLGGAAPRLVGVNYGS
jgi:hypothetical protein